jgi:hypothetical protein
VTPIEVLDAELQRFVGAEVFDVTWVLDRRCRTGAASDDLIVLLRGILDGLTTGERQR